MRGLQFILKRKILIGLLSTLIVIVGVCGILHLDEELLPAVSMDGGYIQVDAGEMQASEVERSITTPLERQLEGVEGIKEISSTSYTGQSSIQMTFDRGKGEEAMKEAESAANQVTSTINSIERVDSGQYGTTQSYQFFFDISGDDKEEMTKFAEDILEPRLEELPEVRDVDLSGVLKEEILIQFDQKELEKQNLNVNNILPIIQQSSKEQTLGTLSGEKGSPSIRWTSDSESIQDIENINIPTQQGAVQLKDLASIEIQPKEQSSLVWKGGDNDFIFAQVGSAEDSTDIETAAAVRSEIKAMKKEGLAEGINLKEIVAQADYVEDSISGVTSNILIGGVIAVAVLLLFLRNIRATLIVSISIPTSILLTIAAIWMFDYSLNILTLIGLGLGIGMMVDSSIVILESIYQKKEQGLKGMDAVMQGVQEVASAVIASMLTTIVVFLPIGLLGGEMGRFMIVLSIVVAITLISSVIISFTLIPSLSEKFLKVKERSKIKGDGPIIRFYEKMVSWTVQKKRHSLVVLSFFLILFIGSLFLVTKIPMTIMPDMFNRYSEVMVDVEEGISSSDKKQIIEKIHTKLENVQDIESSYILDNGDFLYTLINMTKGEEITKEQSEVNEDILKSLRSLEETQPINNVASVMEGGGGSPVQVQIKGESFEELQQLSSEFKEKLEEIDGIVAAHTSMDHASKEQVVELNHMEIEKFGLNDSTIRQQMEQAFLDQPLGEWNLNQESVPLRAAWQEPTVSKSALFDWSIPTADGKKDLAAFINLKTVDTPNEINHIDGVRYATVSADIEGRDLGAVNRDVQKAIESFDSPSGYTLSLAGDLEQQQELIQEMIVIFAIAIFLVYLVMAVQFNHLFHPLIVMAVIPMTIVGVILGLFITQQELSVMSAMGIVMLIGIVLNNAILFITRTNQLRNRGSDVETSLIQAGKDRIRPIFMTSLTTAGGMLPLALATGSAGNYQAPMATVIISGLLFATFITLLLIPAAYRIFSKRKRKVNKGMDSLPEEPAI
ncbi:efflux RND transporter permease subunit [Halobacillus litoralis]|uniref:efflux RND transporter permease subunit n=1 Tax=Halobacillus litoralis TaxID=45668 RepID=UPI001CFEEC0A|nr:efflux RND transporter permease subunit [Halobacillus litoralis]